MNKKTSITKRCKKWYLSLSSLQKTLLVSLTAMFLVALIFNMGVEAWNGHHGKYIYSSQYTDIGISTYYSLNDKPLWERLLFEYQSIIILLALGLSLRWIFHGVQVRLLACIKYK